MFQSDKNRISMSRQPQYVVQGRFQRINQHPVMFPSLFLSCSHLLTLDQVFDTPPTQDASVHSFSIGVTEVINSNLRIELSADDIEYMYQRYICWPRPYSFEINKYRQIYVYQVFILISIQLLQPYLYLLTTALLLKLDAIQITSVPLNLCHV